MGRDTGKIQCSVGYRSSTSPPSCSCGMASSWLVYVVVCPGSILIPFALIASAISFFRYTIAFSCIQIHDAFFGSDSSSIPIVSSPTSRSQLANIDTSSFSTYDKFPWTEESFSSKGNSNREWAVRPDGSNSDAILEEETTSTIFPLVVGDSLNLRVPVFYLPWFRLLCYDR
nr:hypothetical protein [Tanacetum cinerariifolium]